MKSLMLVLAFVLTACGNGCSKKVVPVNSNSVPDQIDPSKPFVLVIGDEYSTELTKQVNKLNISYNYIHIQGNAGTTENGVKNIDSWLLSPATKLIVFNFGIEDLRNPDITVDKYESNLRTIASRIKNSGIKAVFLNTTEFGDPINFPALMSRSADFRAAADKVMLDYGIESIDMLSIGDDISLRARKINEVVLKQLP